MSEQPPCSLSEVGGRVSGHRRSVCARGFLPRGRPGGRRGRRGLRHLHHAAGEPAAEGRQDARAVRQGQHAAHARAAVGRPPARHREPRWRRRGPLRLPGVSLSHLIKNPLLFLEPPARCTRVARRCSRVDRASKLNYVGRVRGYRDLTEGTNIDLGVSFAHRPSDAGAGAVPVETLNKRLFGIDATFRYRPLRRAIYRRFIVAPSSSGAASDVADVRAEPPSGSTAAGSTSSRAAGSSAAATIGPDARSTLAARHGRFGFPDVLAERVQPDSRPVSPHQLRRGHRANEFLFQFNFSIGAHGAHVF